MRRVRLTPEAKARLAAQIEFLIDGSSPLAAQSLKTRVESFLARVLAPFPKTGRFLAEQNLWETWIPGTRLIAWYDFSDSELVVVSFWHSSQNRPLA